MVEEMADKELEDQLMEAGTKLLKVPDSVDELLALLDEVEGYLARVEQSPAKTMQGALSPCLKALVSSDLLRHADMDVKVSVASCVSEITRITAPDAPYTDDQMKQIFQLIVGAFEMLWDSSSRSFSKRVSILETVAKVRSCVVMLDLECDGLILEMFQHFLQSVRDIHSESVFSSMETIMSLVLEESEEISPELLYPLLNSVKRENQGILPVARKLGEKVLESCTSKLKPYLLLAVKSLGMSPNDYSKIVASICQESSDTTEHNDDSVSGEHLADERSSPEKTGSDKPPQIAEELKPEAAFPGEVDMVSDKSVKFVTSNGEAQNVKDDSLVGADSPSKEEFSQFDPRVGQVEPDNLDPNISKAEIKVEPSAKKKRGRKPKISTDTPEASVHSNMDVDKETTGLPSHGKSRSKEDDNSISEDQSIDKSVLPLGPEKEAVPHLSSPTESRDEPAKVASPSPSQSLPEEQTKRARPGRTKKGKVKEDTDRCSPSVPKEALSNEQVEPDAPLSADAASERGPEGDEIEEKPNTRSGKKAQSDKENEEKSSGDTTDSDEKPLKKSSKKAETRGSKNEGSSAKKQSDKTKKGSKSIPEKELPGESSNKKTGSTLKSTSKSQKSLEETPRAKSKRKRTPAKEETSENPSDKDVGQNLVGSKIKVWWPDDKKFYEGIVESFYPKQKKHKVSYRDGDEEILTLNNERWEVIDDYTVSDEDQATNLSSPNASSEMPQRKKGKTNSGLASKQPKTDSSLKKGKETSTRKSNDEVAKSAHKSKNDVVENTTKTASNSKNNSIDKSKGSTPKTGSKSKDDTAKTVTKGKGDTPKTGTKSKVGTPKAATKSKDGMTSTKPKDATPKTGTRSKDDTPKTETKSEDDTTKTRTKSKTVTPKTGSKSGANGTSAKGKPGTSKVQESEGAGKGKSSELAKAQEGETKSGNKRKRVKG